MPASNKKKCTEFSEGVIQQWNHKQVKNPFTNRTIRFFTRTFEDISNRCSMYNDCKTMKGLSNYKSFSCYLDSVLFLLLAIENKYVHRYILFKDLTVSNIGKECVKTDPEKNLQAVQSIQDALQKLCFEIRHGAYLSSIQCKDFLKILRSMCKDTSYPKFYKTRQRAPNDFLSFLFEVFRIDDHLHLTILQKNQYKTSSGHKSFLRQFTTSTETKNAHCIWNVPVGVIGDKPCHLKEFMTIQEDDTLSSPIFHEKDTGKLHPIAYYKTTRRYKKVPPFFVMEVSRIDPLTGIFVGTRITPDLHIKDVSLYGIIVHVGYIQQQVTGMQGSVGSGHYIAYFACKGKWFEYNDLGPSLTYIGGYKDLLENTNVAEKGVLYFYSK